jgi:hypothetical protein
VKEGEYGGSTMYSCMKNGAIRPVETVLRKGEKGVKEKDGVEGSN